jgi:hypothetical protein
MSEKQLAATVAEAVRIRRVMLDDGASMDDADAALERSIRLAWPFTREWKYLCDKCRDCGLEMLFCPGDATCGRTKGHLPHDFGVPCWCPKGKVFRPKERSEVDELASIGKQPKTFTRFGK